MKVLVGVNVLSVVDALIYGNHCKFWAQCLKSFPDDTFELFAPQRMGIERMRNECAIYVLANNFDYIVFLDDDVLLPDFAMEKLMKTLSIVNPVCSGLTYIRSYPFKPMIFRRYTDGKTTFLKIFEDFEEFKTYDGLVYVDAVGFSFCGIYVPLLKKLNPPYFVTGTKNTEDVYFCCKVKDYSQDIPIICDTKIETGHLCGPNVIHPQNVKRMQQIEESFILEGPDEFNPRSKEWIEKQRDDVENLRMI